MDGSDCIQVEMYDLFWSGLLDLSIDGAFCSAGVPRCSLEAWRVEGCLPSPWADACRDIHVCETLFFAFRPKAKPLTPPTSTHTPILYNSIASTLIRIMHRREPNHHDPSMQNAQSVVRLILSPHHYSDTCPVHAHSHPSTYPAREPDTLSIAAPH